jgi:hypothetical protein
MDEQSNALAQERTVQDLKPVAQLSTQEIVAEARDLRAHFRQLAERYAQAQATQRAEIREEMQPLVNRERELREEFSGRVNPEVTRDRVPEQQIAFGR